MSSGCLAFLIWSRLHDVSFFSEDCLLAWSTEEWRKFVPWSTADLCVSCDSLWWSKISCCRPENCMPAESPIGSLDRLVVVAVNVGLEGVPWSTNSLFLSINGKLWGPKLSSAGVENSLAIPADVGVLLTVAEILAKGRRDGRDELLSSPAIEVLSDALGRKSFEG